MPYYRKCPICGSTLDPSEICADCRNEARAKQEKPQKTAPVQQHQDGQVESELSDPHSTSEYKPN